MDEQLKQLFDYTKFHIGMYTTLGTLLIGAMTFVGTNAPTTPKSPATYALTAYSNWLPAPLLLLLVAGMAGGMVGSSIPDHTTYSTFLKTRLGPWSRQWFEAQTWIHIEHTAFWIAVVLAAVGVVWVRW